MWAEAFLKDRLLFLTSQKQPGKFATKPDTAVYLHLPGLEAGAQGGLARIMKIIIGVWVRLRTPV